MKPNPNTHKRRPTKLDDSCLGLHKVDLRRLSAEEMSEICTVKNQSKEESS
jgi:hypothetical protein